MDRLLEALRRNPDAVAIAVLCLTLGLGRHMASASAAVFHKTARTGIHWICTPNAQDGRVTAIGSEWNPRLPEPPVLPNITR
jgi:hypothetical protein